MIYSFQLAVRFLLYAPSHGEDSTYHGLCYTSRGTLDETRNCSMDPPWWIDLMTHWTMGGCSASCLIINTMQIWQSLYGKIYHFIISECHGSIFKLIVDQSLIIFTKFKIQIWPNLSTEFSSSWLLNAMILSSLFETIFKFFIVQSLIIYTKYKNLIWSNLSTGSCGSWFLIPVWNIYVFTITGIMALSISYWSHI